MKLDPTPEGFAVDARDLGPLLGLAPDEVQSLMRAGAIRSIFERGVGEDAGRFRLTFIHRGTRLRLTCDSEGNVLKQSRITAPVVTG